MWVPRKVYSGLRKRTSRDSWMGQLLGGKNSWLGPRALLREAKKGNYYLLITYCIPGTMLDVFVEHIPSSSPKEL